jgi:hypothetical protein
MRSLTTNQRLALQQPGIMSRFFILFLSDMTGFWNDVGEVTVTSTGEVELTDQLFHGSGPVISVATLGAKGDLTIPGMQITLSGVDPRSITRVRGGVIAQTPVEIYIGIFDPASHNIIDGLFRHFTGVVDDVLITTPEAGGTASIVLTCESTSRALTVSGTATRSRESCITRDPNDTFYDDTGVQKDKSLYFGQRNPATPHEDQAVENFG